MNNKKIVLMVIVLLAVIIGVFVGLEAKKESWFTNNNNSVSMSVASVNQSDSFFNIKAEYPQFNISGAEVFNKKVADLINGRISDFKKNSQDNWTARRATATSDNPIPENPEQPFDFIETWKPAQLNNKYLSFYVDMYYFEGGAHGAEEIGAFNYDVAENKEIGIFDFVGGQENLNKLSEISKQRIKDQLTGQGIQIDDFLTQMINDGTAPTADNFDAFIFDQNSLTIYFQQYQVAPGVAGTINITFYKTELNQNNINTDYLQ